MDIYMDIFMCISIIIYICRSLYTHKHMHMLTYMHEHVCIHVHTHTQAYDLNTSRRTRRKCKHYLLLEGRSGGREFLSFNFWVLNHLNLWPILKEKNSRILKDYSPNNADKLGLVGSGFRESQKYSYKQFFSFFQLKFITIWWAHWWDFRPGTTWFYLICKLAMTCTSKTF